VFGQDGLEKTAFILVLELNLVSRGHADLGDPVQSNACEISTMVVII
jgi:hypothetical protein